MEIARIIAGLTRALFGPAAKPTTPPPAPAYRIIRGRTRVANQQAIAVEADSFEDCCAGVNHVRAGMPEHTAVVCFGDIIATDRRYVCLGRILFVGGA